MASVAALNNLGDYAHNPRGNLWFNNESTYGHKLLTKMGWNKGKGLGKNEDGIKENLKVKFRSTNTGLGFKDDPYANIMKSEYESILKSLSAEYSHHKKSSVPKKEIEKTEKLQDSKSRVVKSKIRYPKLFFGKDVTKYSEKDMKSIFICSLPDKNNQEDGDKDSKDLPQKTSESEPLKASCMSVADYFSQKMKEKKSNAVNKDVNKVLDYQQSSLESTNSQTDALTANKTLSKRKRKHYEIDDSVETVNNSFSGQHCIKSEDSEIADVTVYSHIKSSHKKKEKCHISTDRVKLDSSHSDVNETASKDINTERSKVSENVVCKNNFSDSLKYDIADVESCQASKKRKKSHLVVNECSFENTSDILSENIGLMELNSLPSLTKKKKKKNKKRDAVECVEMNAISSSEHVENSVPTVANSHKKKKKSKKVLQRLKSCLKSKKDSYLLKNVSFNENVFYRIIDTEIESVGSLVDSQPVVLDKFCDVTDDEPDNGDSSCSIKDTASEENNLSASFSVKEEKVECVEQEKVESIKQEKVASVKQEKVDSIKQEKVASVKQQKVESVKQEKVESVEQEKVESVEQEKAGSNEAYTLSDLPSSKSSHFNFWIDSQRQALKMKLYKNMLKSIRKHKVLSTTNLLSIKGYGNWGFK